MRSFPMYVYTESAWIQDPSRSSENRATLPLTCPALTNAFQNSAYLNIFAPPPSGHWKRHPLFSTTVTEFAEVLGWLSIALSWSSEAPAGALMILRNFRTVYRNGSGVRSSITFLLLLLLLFLLFLLFLQPRYVLAYGWNLFGFGYQWIEKKILPRQLLNFSEIILESCNPLTSKKIICVSEVAWAL